MTEDAAFGSDLRRVIAPNPSPFTARGTNTWLLGRGDLCLIDPGPDDPRHLSALRRAIGDQRVGVIVVTHAHLDHSGLAPALSAETGAPILAFGDAWAGRRPLPSDFGPGLGVDHGFRPDRTLADGEEIAGDGWRLRAVHTPGHMGNHLCLDDGARLFTGDHAMGFATSLVSPPEGDMGDYVDSLRRLMAVGERRLLPGHGDAVADGAGRLSALLEHRLTRYAEVLARLDEAPGSAADIAARIYAGLPEALRRAGERNVLAHLLDLHRRGRVAPLGALSDRTTFRCV